MTDDRYLKRTIVKETAVSSFLPEGSRDLRIYLPPGYNEVLSYPAVYCQDGEDFFNFGRIATIANKLILDGELEPFVIIGVDVNKKLRTSEYSPDGGRHEAYVRFFGEELVPFLESRYPIRRERSERLLAGDSLGGTVSLHLALRYPDLFSNILSLSGAFYEASQAIVAAADNLAGLNLYMHVGLQETAYETDHGTFDFVTLNRQMKELLEARGASLHYTEKDGKHQWGSWQKELPDGLAYFLD
ncbi:alpha/beta hydrolase [Paenibacillus beijingensis]|uniref:Enterochelin esterase n=1 Tax=Paenibacillus beijingensis TaxID=1126833 RepID=A0A0D5NPE7_9BACL|nr:alpha/beta hydrolase-fold protein [Paenibacillus beijingensis]AJY77055.1 enterochelin esterase [Paenibacillus beijingensis]